VKIQLSDAERSLVSDSGFKQFNDIACLAFRKWAGLPITTDRVYLKNKTVCLKTQPASNTYPELKEKVGANTADYYVLITIDSKQGVAYLEGWATRDGFVNDKNLNLDGDVYYQSYKDLQPMSSLKL
jgi:hypothetical protein